MKNFTSELLKREIIIISDYVDPLTYSKSELNDEARFIHTIKKEMDEYGVRSEYLEVRTLNNLKTALEKFNKDDVVIFNWCEFIEEKEGTAYLVAEFLEKAGYVFTGADTACLKLTNSKEDTKIQLRRNGIPTPEYFILRESDSDSIANYKFPLILKLEDRHSSAGMTSENVVRNTEQLLKVSQRLFSTFHTDIIAEEFVDGQEYTATIWGNGNELACIYFTKEMYINPKISMINTESGKFSHGSVDEKNLVTEPLDDDNTKIISKISEIVVKSFRALKFSDYGRFELREKNNELFVIDCNANPWIGMDAVLFKGTKRLGYNFGETLLQICEFAVKRNSK